MLLKGSAGPKAMATCAPAGTMVTTSYDMAGEDVPMHRLSFSGHAHERNDFSLQQTTPDKMVPSDVFSHSVEEQRVRLRIEEAYRSLLSKRLAR